MASRITQKPMRTFALLFAPEIETDKKRKDKEHARQIAARLGTEHREGMLTPDDFRSGLPAVLKAVSEPYACSMSMCFVCDFAKQYTDNALAGDWADERFGSYEEHRRAAPHPQENAPQIRYAASVFSDEEKQDLYTGAVRGRARAFSTRRHLESYFRNLTAEDPLNKMLEGWLRSVFPDNTLMPVVRLSQAHCADVRSPYADPGVADFVTKIPGELKIRDGETKYIMKRLALRYLPEELVFREKELFTPPLLTLATRSEPYIRSRLSPERLGTRGFFDEGYVQASLDAFFEGPTKSLAYRLWTPVAFQVWYELQAG